MAWENLISAIENVITTNGSNDITGQTLRELLTNNIIPILGKDRFLGIATPSTVPGATSNESFYFATEAGVYANLGGQDLEKGLHFFYFKNSSWQYQLLIDGAITSFDNVGGVGGRSTLINLSVSQDLIVGNSLALINGVIENNASFVPNTPIANKFISFSFGEISQIISKIRWIQGSTATHGLWKIQASNDNTVWGDVSADFTLGGSTTQIISLNPIPAGYFHYRIIGVSGNASGNPYINEIEFKIGAGTLTKEVSKIPSALNSKLVEAYFFKESDSTKIVGVQGSEIDLETPTNPNYTKTAKGIKILNGLVQTPLLAGVRAVTILYKSKANALGGFLISGGYVSGTGTMEENIAGGEINKMYGAGLGWHNILSRSDSSTGGAVENNRGGWALLHRGHTQNYDSVYGLGGRHSTTTSRCSEFEIAMAFFWNAEPSATDLENLSNFVRKEALNSEIYLNSDDCEKKKDLTLILGESTSVARSTLANLSANDLALNLRKTSFVGQTSGGNGATKMAILEMGLNQQTDNLADFGPEFGVAFQRRLNSTSLNDQIVLSLGKGGSRIADSATTGAPVGWNISENESIGLFYKALRQIYFSLREAFTYGIGINKKIKIGFWIGLNDATSINYAGSVAVYQSYLQSFYDKFVEVFDGYDVEMVIFRAHPHDPISNASALSNIRQATDNFAAANMLVNSIDTDAYGLEPDGVHYDAAASKAMGITLHG